MKDVPFTVNGFRGVSLAELIVALALLVVGLVGLAATFSGIGRSALRTKNKTIATGLAQEKVERLKGCSYYRLSVTTETLADLHFPGLLYDIREEHRESFERAGIAFERRVLIRKVEEDASGDLNYLLPTDPDAGMKEIYVYVSWEEGGRWKKSDLRTIMKRADLQPLSSAVSGRVVGSGYAPLTGARVSAVENPRRHAHAKADGTYKFGVEPGTYTIRADFYGYFSQTIPTVYAPPNGSAGSKDFALVRMDSGTVSGDLWVADHLLISEVCPEMNNSDDQEYVEIYNPTTYSWAVNGLDLKYFDKTNTEQSFGGISFSGTHQIAAGGYFLIASVGTLPNGRSADAIYSSHQIKTVAAGGIVLTVLGKTDKVAWGKDLVSANQKPPDQAKEGTGLELIAVDGPGNNQCLERKAILTSTKISLDAGGADVSFGNGYDSNRNEDDWVFMDDLGHAMGHGAYLPAQNTSTGLEDSHGATPAEGAVVFADDGLSPAVVADAAGHFELKGVATGTWTLTASTSGKCAIVENVGGTAANFSVTLPPVFLTTDTAEGYVKGVVQDIDHGPLAGLPVNALGVIGRTTETGMYVLAVPEGVGSVTANWEFENPSFLQMTEENVTVTPGALVDDVSFHLPGAGSIIGKVNLADGTPLPLIPVMAFQETEEKGRAVTDAQGDFEIPDLCTGTYRVEPEVFSNETFSPTPIVTINCGPNDVGTLTLGANLGRVTGVALAGGVPIRDGPLLIYVTTSVLSGYPPEVSSTTWTGAEAFFGTTTQGDGTFGLLVPPGNNYRVYAWRTVIVDDKPVSTRRESEVFSLAAGAQQAVVLDW